MIIRIINPQGINLGNEKLSLQRFTGEHHVRTLAGRITNLKFLLCS